MINANLKIDTPHIRPSDWFYGKGWERERTYRRTL